MDRWVQRRNPLSQCCNTLYASASAMLSGLAKKLVRGFFCTVVLSRSAVTMYAVNGKRCVFR